MSEVWVGAIAGLVGVTLGGGIGLGNNLLQRKWQMQDQRSQVEQTRHNEVRVRMDAKALELLEQLADIEAILSRHVVISRSDLWPDPETKAAARALLSRVAVDSGYLTQPLRGHVRVVVNLLPDAERLAGERWVDMSARGVAHTAIRWARRNLERYVRGESVPEDRGEPIDSYVEAWNDLQAMIERDLSAQEEDQP